MKSKLLLTLAGLATAGSLSAQTLIYDFGAGTSGAPTGSIANIVFSTATSNNNNGNPTIYSTASASSGYPGATGSGNIGGAARIGALDLTAGTGSAYFEFTLTPSSGFFLTLSSLSLGERSTGTGPTTLTIRTSLDNFSVNLATATVATTSTWALVTPTFTAVSGSVDQAITVRIYGSGGAGSASAGTVNFRADDIAVGATATPVPEPSAIALGILGLAGMMALRRRRN